MNAGDEARLRDLERQVALLQKRIDRLERARPNEATPEPEHEDHAISADRAEYLIGAQVLPRLGAGVIVLATLLVAALGSSKTSGIDPMMVLGIELIASLGFIAVGEWKRSELEGFGRVLTGIGACGLFLSAANARFAYGIMSADALSLTFAALSVVWIGYSYWRSSPAFYVIGVLGGVCGAVLALPGHSYAVCCIAWVLPALVGAPVAARRNWPAVAVIHWLTTVLLVVPFIAYDLQWPALIGCLYLSSAALIGAYAFCGRRSETWLLATPLGLFITAWIGFALQHETYGVLHLFILSALGLAIARLMPDGKPRVGVAVGALAVLGLLGPACLTPAGAAAAYALCALVAGLSRQTRWARLAAIFALAELGLCVAYFATVAKVDAGSLWLAIASLAVATIGSGLAVRRAGWNGLLVACIGLWVVVNAVAQMLNSSGPEAFSTTTLAWLGYAVVLLVAGFARGSATLRFFSLGVMSLSACKILLLDHGTSVGFKIGALLALGLLMLFGGYAYIHARRLPATSDQLP